MAENIKDSIGLRMREIRTKRGFTQESLAEKVGLSTNFVGSIERGEVNASFQTLEAIAKALDSDLRQFFDTEYLEVNERELSKLLHKQIKYLDRDQKRLLLKVADFLGNQ